MPTEKTSLTNKKTIHQKSATDDLLVTLGDIVTDPELKLEDLHAFIWTEHIAQNIAYAAISRSDKTVQIKEENGDLRIYCSEKLRTPELGMVGELLTPMHPSITNANNLYISFTGTHSKVTFLADFQRSPGEEFFREAEIDIFLNQINQKIKEIHEKTGQCINIILAGHSLGGAYAQLGFHSLQHAIATNIHELSTIPDWDKQSEKFRKDLNTQVPHINEGIPHSVRTHLTSQYICSLTLGVWNSSGVLKAVEEHSHILAPIINKVGIKQRALFGMVEGDAVQLTGEGTILSHIDDSIAQVQVVIIDKKHEWIDKKASQSLSTSSTAVNLGAPGIIAMFYMDVQETVGKHRNTHFNDFDIMGEALIGKLKFEYLANNSMENIKKIHKYLDKKSKMLNVIAVTKFRNWLYSLLQFIIEKI